jgi:hypothetical protein
MFICCKFLNTRKLYVHVLTAPLLKIMFTKVTGPLKSAKFLQNLEVNVI